MLTNLSRPNLRRTELEEELHETAHIDYNRVAIVCLLVVYLGTEQFLLTSFRLPTRPLPVCTRMLLCTSLALPSPPPVR